MTDPFLLSAHDDESAPATRPTGRTGELALRSGLPRAILDIVPAEVVEDFVRREETWADLAAGLREALEAAGFHRHDPSGSEGGFHLASGLRDDGVLVSWSARWDRPDEPGRLARAIETIMRPALLAILAACGFTAQAIPEGQDDAGYILVTSHADPPA